MKKLRILWRVLCQTRADEILLSYLVFVLADALVIFLFDPAIASYGNALWYCCAVISTVGFGDFVATTMITKIATVLLMIYSVFVVAIVTGVIVNFYSQIIQLKQEQTLTSFLQQIERLDELSKSELKALSQRVAEFQKNRKI